MTDRELLEAAAKAASLNVIWHEDLQRMVYFVGSASSKPAVWNPLLYDGDAFRLAVRLGIPVFPYDDETSTGTVGVVAKNWGSKEANTRRAIVRAAASMGWSDE